MTARPNHFDMTWLISRRGPTRPRVIEVASHILRSRSRFSISVCRSRRQPSIVPSSARFVKGSSQLSRADSSIALVRAAGSKARPAPRCTADQRRERESKLACPHTQGGSLESPVTPSRCMTYSGNIWLVPGLAQGVAGLRSTVSRRRSTLEPRALLVPVRRRRVPRGSEAAVARR
jgi:hypothetical protein